MNRPGAAASQDITTLVAFQACKAETDQRPTYVYPRRQVQPGPQVISLYLSSWCTDGHSSKHCIVAADA